MDVKGWTPQDAREWAAGWAEGDDDGAAAVGRRLAETLEELAKVKEERDGTEKLWETAIRIGAQSMKILSDRVALLEDLLREAADRVADESSAVSDFREHYTSNAKIKRDRVTAWLDRIKFALRRNERT